MVKTITKGINLKVSTKKNPHKNSGPLKEKMNFKNINTGGFNCNQYKENAFFEARSFTINQSRFELNKKIETIVDY